MTSAAPGDAVYLGSVLTNVHCWGIVSDIETPAGMTATFEVVGNDGALTLDALVGPEGPAGENAPIVKMQYSSPIDNPDDLPQDLTDDEIDIGKAWWIGNQVYMWGGSSYIQKAMGTQGPPGPTPRIHPHIELIDPDGTEVSSVVKTGTDMDVSMLFKIKAPRGPQGTPARIVDSPDYDNTQAPDVGDAIVWNGTKWHSTSATPMVPKFYSVPEGAFTNFTGLATRQTIAVFQVPQQPWDWTPVVHGHMRAIGVELDSDPLILGCEVRLGNPASGTLVARGFGNLSTYANIVPHYSTPQSTSDAISPTNAHALVPAAHTGTTGTLYVNLFNDGLTGAYVFNRKNAQITVMVLPVGETSIWESGS